MAERNVEQTRCTQGEANPSSHSALAGTGRMMKYRCKKQLMAGHTWLRVKSPPLHFV